MKGTIEHRIIGLSLLILVLLAGLSIAALRNIRYSAASSDWVNHTHAVILEANAIVSSLNAGEAALRDYLLAQFPRDLDASRRAYADAIEHLEVGQALVSQEPAQHEKFRQIEPLIARRVDFAREAIKTRQEKGIEAMPQALAASPATLLEISDRVKKIVDEEQELLRQRDKESYLQAQRTRWTVLTGVVLNGVILIFGVYLLRDDLAARRRAAEVLAEANQRLEAAVTARTLEAASANEALRQENLEQRWSNQALDHQLRYNHLIINSIGDLVFVISKRLSISRINSAVTRNAGFESHELVGGPLRRVVRPPAGADAKTDPILVSLKEGRDLIDAPGILHRRDQQEIPVRFSVFPLRDGDKVVGGVLIIQLSLAQAGGQNPHSPESI